MCIRDRGFIGTFLGVAYAFAQNVNVNLGDGAGLTAVSYTHLIAILEIS